MRTAIVETFQSTMNQCFATIVENIPGRTVREEIFQQLSRNGIQPSEISSRFDDVVEVLTSAFGEGARVLVFKTVTELYKEYSQRAGFTFGESLRDRITLLRERLITNLLKQKKTSQPQRSDPYHIPEATEIRSSTCSGSTIRRSVFRVTQLNVDTVRGSARFWIP